MSDSARADVPTGLNAKQRRLAHVHASVLAKCPSGRFITAEKRDCDLPHVDMSLSTLKTLTAGGVIQRVGTLRKAKGSNESRGRIWRVLPEARRVAADCAGETNSPCGCGHSGIRNLGDDTYTCCDDDCDVRVTRPEVRGDA